MSFSYFEEEEEEELEVLVARCDLGRDGGLDEHEMRRLLEVCHEAI